METQPPTLGLTLSCPSAGLALGLRFDAGAEVAPRLAGADLGPAFSAVRHFLAAFTTALCCSPVFALAIFETHFPNALALFLLVPYLAVKASTPSARSALHVLAALVVLTSCLSAWAVTQAPKFAYSFPAPIRPGLSLRSPSDSGQEPPQTLPAPSSPQRRPQTKVPFSFCSPS